MYLNPARKLTYFQEVPFHGGFQGFNDLNRLKIIGFTVRVA